MSFSSELSFLPAGDCPTTHSIPLHSLTPRLPSQDFLLMTAGPRYIASARTAQKTLLPTALLLSRSCVLRPLSSNGRGLQSHYLVTVIAPLLIPRSLPSNGCRCHNIKTLYKKKVRVTGIRLLMVGWVLSIRIHVLKRERN
jgi:hypothetical protein